MIDSCERTEVRVTLIRLYFPGHYYLPPYLNERTMKKLRLMREAYDNNHSIFYVRKGSPYKKSLNAILQRARDAGLFYYWEALTARNYMNFRDQIAVTESVAKIEPVPTPLRIKHITVSIHPKLYKKLAFSLVKQLLLRNS